MVFRHKLFKRVAIVGTGLIGGSIGLAIKKHAIADKVIGISRQESTIRAAIEMGAIDDTAPDLQKVIQGSELVILAGPVKVIIDQLKEVGKYLRRGAIVTDVGSSKAAIVEAAQKYLPPHVLFVGSHPMAGSERSGVSHASADLFNGATCIMTPTEKTNRLAREKVKHFWTSLGADVRMMDAVQHDEILAFVSHLPHIISYAMMRSIPDDFLQHASTGLRDTSRVAGSSPKMWADICLSNYRNVLKSIDESVKSLAEIRKAIVDKDEQALSYFFNQAKAKKEMLDSKK